MNLLAKTAKKTYEVTITANVMSRTTPGGNKGILVTKGSTYTVTTVTTVSGKKWYKLASNKYVSENYVKAKVIYEEEPDGTISFTSPNPSTNSNLKNPAQLDRQVTKIINQATAANENKLDGSMRLFGLPHQFTKETDPRLSETTGLGTMFTETFVLNAPIIYIKPGVSNFMPGVSKVEKRNTLNAIIAAATGNLEKGFAEALSGMVDNDYRYFDFQPDFYGLMRRANVLCRACAIFLGIGRDKVPWTDGATWGNYDWSGYTFSNLYSVKKSNATNGKRDAVAFVGDMFDKLTTDNNNIQFYVDANASYSEGASNGTTTSMISQYTEGLQTLGKELSFVSGVTGLNIDEIVGESASVVDDAVNKLATGDGAIRNFLKRLTGTGTQILKGSNFLAPDIWSSSDYSKSYSFTITLSTPYGNVYSRFLNIIVPMMMILALTLPVQTSANTYGAPSLIKAWVPGWFSSDLAIVDSINIEKAPSGDAWGIDGLPNEVRISLSIKDLYANLAIPDLSNSSEFKLLYSNTGLLDYLMVNCGLDIRKAYFDDKINLFVNLLGNNIKDTVKAVTSLSYFEGTFAAIRSVFGIGSNW